MFTLAMTTTSYLRQVARATSASSEVNLRLALRRRDAYRLKRYVVISRFLFGSSSYENVVHTAQIFTT